MATTAARAGARRPVVVPLRKRAKAGLRGHAPSARALAIAVGLALAIGALYSLARFSPIFTVETIQVTGGNAAVRAEVRSALARFDGSNLVGFDGAALRRATLAIPEVRAVEYDRAFPHTLSVVVKRERAVAVLRRGAQAWLAAASGKVISPLPRRAQADLPRIWLAKKLPLKAGSSISEPTLRLALNALGAVTVPSKRLHLVSVRATPSELTLVTRTGIEIRLGDASDAALKFELARRILPRLVPASAGTTYLDLSLPSRPVSGIEIAPVHESEDTVATELSENSQPSSKG